MLDSCDLHAEFRILYQFIVIGLQENLWVIQNGTDNNAQKAMSWRLMFIP